MALPLDFPLGNPDTMGNVNFVSYFNLWCNGMCPILCFAVVIWFWASGFVYFMWKKTISFLLHTGEN